MPCCRNAFDPAGRCQRLRGYIRALALAWLLALSSHAASAAGIEPLSARLSAGEDTYILSADFNVDLGSRLEETLARGVPLYFVLELEITRNRWFWPGEHIAGRSVGYRLAYIPLTRQYRLSTGNALHRNFSTLNEALQVLAHAVALPVAEKNALKPGENYHAAVRLTLDHQQLPKPLQVDAIVNRDWDLEAKVLRWQFTASAANSEREAK